MQIQGIPAPGGPFGRNRTEQDEELASDAVVRLLQMTEALLQPAVLRQLTGVAIETIAWMGSEARAAEGLDVFGPLGFDLSHRGLEQTLASEEAFAELYGPLPFGYPRCTCDRTCAC